MFRRYPFATIILGVFVVMALPFVAIYYMLTFDCGADHIRKTLSPGARNRVIVFRKNCGATTAFSTQAVLLPAWQPFILTFSTPFFVSDEADDLRVRWLDDNTIQIKRPKAVRIFRQDRKVDGVAVVYR